MDKYYFSLENYRKLRILSIMDEAIITYDIGKKEGKKKDISVEFDFIQNKLSSVLKKKKELLN